MAKKIADLEKDNVSGKDSLYHLQQLQRAYLLTSLLKPNKCDTLFYKLLKNWFDVAVPVQFENVEIALSDYKIWLADILNSRFKAQTDEFINFAERCRYRKAIDILQKPFKNVTDERSKIALAKKTSAFLNNDSVMAKIYYSRAAHISQIYASNRSDSLSKFIEFLFLETIKLQPNDLSLLPNVFIFYYNEGAYLMQSLNDSMTKKEKNDIQSRAKAYFKKALYYAKKAGIEPDPANSTE